MNARHKASIAPLSCSILAGGYLASQRAVYSASSSDDNRVTHIGSRRVYRIQYISIINYYI